MTAVSRSSAPLILLALAIAGGALGGAYYLQYVEGLDPCKLCLWQRIPYYAGLPLALAALISPGGVRRALALLAGLAFVVAVGLAMYHVGVEQEWWKGPQSCSGGAILSTGGSLAERMEALSRPQPASCTDIPWSFLGLSLAGWNVAVTAATAGLLLAAAARRG